ncbi:MAG: DNA replication/repair protein RecF [Gammaproteobacteria bacterium]|nr:MAG: DNA replication/repair protein RecF [Gammaproteobacteria bacterium]
MAISQLSLTDFRNLKSTTLDFDRGFNLISGDNGSGKTSLLEAIYVLCQAQSFRTHQIKQCINHDKSGFLLFGRFDGFKAGLARNQHKLEIRIDGETIKRRSELVKKSPIQVVNADSFVLIEGSPGKRRAFLDWCLFHVEPAYAENWRRFQHALKQRNRLLKTKQDLKQLDYWDQYLLEPSNELYVMRKQYSEKLQLVIRDCFEEILEGIPLAIDYQQGWPDDTDLPQSLERSRERDIRLGFTGEGIHRDDLDLRSNGIRVGEVLSRGQSKRVCLVLLLAVLKLVSDASHSPVILLIDDLHSELDQHAQQLIYRQLLQMDLQLFISNIEQVVPAAIEAKEFKMFHVEHGIIRPRIFS